MTLTTKQEHEQDRKNQRKLEGDHHHPCSECGGVVSDQTGITVAGHWFCGKGCHERYIERADYYEHRIKQLANELKENPADHTSKSTAEKLKEVLL